MSQHLRILIVEDQQETAIAMQRFLEFRGHSVDVARSGSTALKKADALQPEVVVSDFKIEGTANGVDVAKEFRSQFDVPIIMVTGHSFGPGALLGLYQ